MKTYLKSPKVRIALLILLTIIAVLVYPITPFAQAQEQPGASENRTAKGSIWVKIIDYYDQLIAKGEMNEEAEEAIEMHKQQAIWQATQNALPTIDPAIELQTVYPHMTERAQTRMPSPNSQRPIGIIDNPVMAYPEKIVAKSIIGTNLWIGKVGDSYIRVFVGSLISDEEQGIVYVFPEPLGQWLEFKTPQKTGAVTIADFKGARLELTTSKGGVLYFDVPGLKFVDNWNEIVPMVTQMFFSSDLTSTPTPPSPYPNP